MSPPCSDGRFPRINDLARAGIDLESAAVSGSMRQLSGPIPATASTGEWGGGRSGKERLVFISMGGGDWWSAV
jgi:hypothetical protein